MIAFVICLFCWIATYCNIASTATSKAFWDCSKGSYQSKSNLLANQPLAGTHSQPHPTTHHHPSLMMGKFMCLWPDLKIGIIVACASRQIVNAECPRQFNLNDGNRWKLWNLPRSAADHPRVKREAQRSQCHSSAPTLGDGLPIQITICERFGDCLLS